MAVWKFDVTKVRFGINANCRSERASWYEEGLLISPDGSTWHVNSGGWGNGPLPPGHYKMGTVDQVFPQSPSYMAMRDRKGLAWRVELSRTILRSNLLIHPDGGVLGTLGCIGVDLRQHPDTSLLFRELQASKVRIMVVRGGVIDDSEYWA